MAQPEAAVLVKTDLHYGKKTETYNVDVTAEVLERVYETVDRLVRLKRKSRPIDEFFDLDVGDMVDGQLIFKTHPFHVDHRASFARAQVNGLRELIVPKMKTLSRRGFKRYNIVSCGGNHGRTSMWSHEADNYDLMLSDDYGLVFRNDKIIKVSTLNRRPDRITIKGHDFMLYHGQTIKMYMKIPWYGIMQRVKDWAFHEPPFYGAIFGHFHGYGKMREAGRVVLLNGTAVVDDDFSREVIGRRGEPVWHLFGVHPEKGITWSYDLYLYGEEVEAVAAN